MSRHAKNACSWAVFSHAERARLTYGTQQRRVGLDAQKPFDHCELCLHVADQPVVCHKGHVFCRGCILESLAAQKETNKLAAAKFEQQQTEAAQADQISAAKLKQQQLDAFQRLDAALLKGNARTDNVVPPPTRPAASTSAAGSAGADAAAAASADGAAAPAGYVRVETNRGVGFVVDRATVHAQNDPNAPREVQAARKAYMPAFWAPSMAPADVGEAKMIAPPPSHCVCPGSNHTLRLKQLRPIRWHREREKAEATVRATSATATVTSNAGHRVICFACKRLLQNQTPMVANLKCGHVSCKACVDSMMRGKKRSQALPAAPAAAGADAAAAPSASATVASSSMLCLECEEPCKDDDLVQIVATGGFAASGNQIAKAKLTPAFRC